MLAADTDQAHHQLATLLPALSLVVCLHSTQPQHTCR